MYMRRQITVPQETSWHHIQHNKEAFQGVEVTGNITRKTGNNPPESIDNQQKRKKELRQWQSII